MPSRIAIFVKMHKDNLRILNWAEEDRPREKLLLKGKGSLSDSELMAILIGSGTLSTSAVELSRQILASVDNNLNNLAKLSIKDLKKFKGIGEAKAITIVSAIELGRRRISSGIIVNPQINSSKNAFEYILSDFMDLKHEEFWIILLNRSNHVISKHQISLGGVHGTVVDSKIIFKIALDQLASSIILVHNHPSGSLKPSDSDIRLTKKLTESGTLLDLPILDHLIVTDSNYYSFADEGIL